MIRFNRILATLVAVVVISFMNPVYAASQCSGLSNSKCASKSNECTWRKASVNKNGVKTKAHCRALPGKSNNIVKNASKAKTNTKSKVANKKSTAKSKSSAAKKTAKSKSAAAKKTAKSKSAATKKTAKSKSAAAKKTAKSKSAAAKKAAKSKSAAAKKAAKKAKEESK